MTYPNSYYILHLEATTKLKNTQLHSIDQQVSETKDEVSLFRGGKLN